MSQLPKNHTPHDIVVIPVAGGPVYSFAKTEPVLRLTQNKEEFCPPLLVGQDQLLTIPIVTPPQYLGLSAHVSGAILVSQMVAEWIVRHPEAVDEMGIDAVYVPDTSPAGVIRNEHGEIIGTRRLVRYL